MKTKKPKPSAMRYWVYFSPTSFDAFIIKKHRDWEPPGVEFKGPFFKARFARQYGRSMAYGEAAKARSKAFAYKKLEIKKKVTE